MLMSLNEFDAIIMEVHALLARRDWTALRLRLAEVPAPELTDLLFEFAKTDRVLLFRALPRPLAADVFSYLSTDEQNTLLTELTDEETRHLLANMRPDDRTHLLEELPGQATQKLLNMLRPADLAEARTLLGYPEESIGRLMTPDYVAVRPEWTVAQALEHIRSKARRSETINTIYVIDEQWHLQDSIEVRRFILAEPEQFVAEIMDFTFVSASAFDDREEAVRLIQRYDLTALPVVGSDGVLLGILTIDDVLDVAQQEATEDFHKGAAIAPVRSYREADIWTLYRRRIIWLIALVFVNLISASVIAAYAEVLTATLALAFFIPLLIGSGGNTGAQSATLMVRALATGDVQLAQWLRTLGKELGVGITLGVTMGLVSYALGFFLGAPAVGIVVGLSMVAIVLFSNLIGILLPFVLTRLNIDPAVASSPLITTIVDASGLIIYFSIAAGILR
jgi:magnesium transporter